MYGWFNEIRCPFYYKRFNKRYPKSIYLQLLIGPSVLLYIEDTCVIPNSLVCWNASFLFKNSNFVAHSLAQWAYFCNKFGTLPFSVVFEFVEGGVG